MANKFEITIQVQEIDSLNELKLSDKKLVEKAIQSADQAYAPYSNFKVGAALLLENGEIISANNQENAAYPSGLCAERIAVFYASANFPGVAIKKIAVTAKSENFQLYKPVTPCGACRQVIAEYEKLQQKKIQILMHGNNGKIWSIDSIESLLPLLFLEEKLKQ